MHWIKRLSLLVSCFFIVSCGDVGSRLPFPTPGRQDLVVLTQPGLLTYDTDDNDNPVGLEYDLAQAFAQELGVSVRFEVAEPGELEASLARGKYHLAAAWLPPSRDPDVQATPPIFLTRDILVQHDASLPLAEPGQLVGKEIHVLAGSRQAATLHRLGGAMPGIKVIEFADGDILDLLDNLGSQRIHYVAIDETFADIANQFVPNLRTSLPLSEASPVVWQLGNHPNPELRARLNAFIERVQHDGTLARLEDRYLGHVRRLTQTDVTKFLGEMETTLPKFRKFFHAAQALTGIDWRLIAAVSYHESNWDPNATSYTNVRGIMMLTEDTADRLQVSNRLDPSESILAGARYINLLKEQLPEDVEEPDRTWLALAAYNIGPGHFNGARQLAKQLKADPNSWYDMKRVLPKLAQPKYYQQLKSGRARGGEAVMLVENIRSYYDILQRNAEPFAPTPSAAEGLKRLVIEIEERRKAYVKRITTAKSISVTEKNDGSSERLRLPTIGQDLSPPRPADKE
ncbi:membrane-bound lytic murein transglycosylase MltF [Dechloromonas sp. HYN0024]|uniref:membrane-bound lytic murein transglycosylase MltF n=1 Tax=Dechloromonas sp. HYN0024 TaxID=2231055 RepID=UPI000E4523D1|nr:membrane-bound lytic murein transglycosylase MltF [Dechloromonas sp. HYN0024]AXS79530.1 membrane-bound lytic murein transglycosylase MltF [Dechloromonas sp. HYN0024]